MQTFYILYIERLNKMKKIILVIIILFLSPYCWAWEPDPWTTQDTILQSFAIGTILFDACQTYTFLYTGNYRERGFYETNKILGMYPSKTRFFTYWGSCVLIHSGVSYILPKPFRTIWQGAWSGIELNYIRHNYSLGIRITSPF